MLWYAIPLLLVPVIGISLLSWKRPVLGLQNGRLPGCPASPNCVCSLDRDAEHAIAPLVFSGEPTAAWTRLEAILAAQPRCRIVTRSTDYLHAEFLTPLLRFVDDLEAHLDPVSKVIHVRSASRVGHSDLGVNRRRVELLRSEFESRSP